MRLLVLLLILAILLTFALSGLWHIGRWFRRMKRRLQVRYTWLQGRQYDDEEDDEDEDDGDQTVPYVYRSSEKR